MTPSKETLIEKPVWLALDIGISKRIVLSY
jgi:hypothetical protein